MSGRPHVVSLPDVRRARRGSTKPPAHNKGPTLQVAVRLAHGLVGRIDAIAAKLSRPGLELSRADSLRIAIESGLERLERE